MLGRRLARPLLAQTKSSPHNSSVDSRAGLGAVEIDPQLQVELRCEDSIRNPHPSLAGCSRQLGASTMPHCLSRSFSPSNAVAVALPTLHPSALCQRGIKKVGEICRAAQHATVCMCRCVQRYDEQRDNKDETPDQAGVLPPHPPGESRSERAIEDHSRPPSSSVRVHQPGSAVYKTPPPSRPFRAQ